MRGERVAQHVRVDVLAEAARPRPRGKASADNGRRDALAARADEERLLRRNGDLVAHVEPGLQGLARLGADRHGARLRALAGHRDLSFVEVEPPVADIEADELAKAQTR